MALGGWSMGRVSAIKALAAMPSGLVRAVVLDPPSVEGCELLYNYSEAEIQADWRSARNRTRAPYFLYTATKDILQTATLQLFSSAKEGESIYAQYKTEYCTSKPPFLNTTIWPSVWGDVPGFPEHCCAGLLTMTAWTTTFLKMALQNASASCHDMIWSETRSSIAVDSRMDAVKWFPSK